MEPPAAAGLGGLLGPVQQGESRVQPYSCSVCGTGICATAAEVNHNVGGDALKLHKCSFLRASCKILSPNLGSHVVS